MNASTVPAVSKKRPRYFATVPPQEILPVIDGNFESSVRGIYIIGDVTGMPLVKVAANQGAAVLAAMQASNCFAGRRADDTRLDVVIIGAGPAGLAAALAAHRGGLRYVVLEREKVANTIRSFPAGKMVYAEPDGIDDRSQLGFAEDVSKEEFVERIGQVVATRQLRVKEHCEVARIRQIADHTSRWKRVMVCRSSAAIA